MKRHIVWILATLMLIGLLGFSPSWAGTFIDDFEDGDLEGWLQLPEVQMTWRVIDGELECSWRRPESLWLVTGEPSWTDCTIEYDVRLLQDHGPGDVDLLARVDPKKFSEGYIFVIGDWAGASEAFVQRLPNWDIKARNPFNPLKLDKWHHLKLEAEGENFTFWINGEIALEYQDNVIHKGMVGLGLANYTARFDNVIITGPDVPDVTPPTWKGQLVEPAGKLATTWGHIRKSD